VAALFSEAGFDILATGMTFETITAAGTPAKHVNKLYQGRPNILDMITNGKIQLIVNTPIGKASVHDDSYIRKNAVKAGIPYITTIAAARMAAQGILRVKKETGELHSLQEWHGMIQ
jgi:carbamoyl-phosphate synthase large subunit